MVAPLARAGSLLVVAAALGCGASRSRPGSPAPLVLQPCLTPGDRAVCGSLAVPEDPRRPAGRAIRLKVVILRALEPRPGAVPLFHLEGGPGVAATQALPFYLGPGRGYRRSRDLVLVDQRGTGGSNPLRCQEIESRSPLEEQYTDRDVDRCRTRLAARADLTRYGTAIAAGDLDRVRAALGLRQIDLWALSYGTQLAQVYLRGYPGRVRRAVLVGAATLDLRSPLHHAAGAQRVLDLLFAQCRADPACAAAHPHLEQSWQLLLARMEADGRVAFAEAIRRHLNTTAGQRGLPALIDRAAGGDPAPLLDALASQQDLVAEGLYLSNVCAEGTLRIEPGQIARFTDNTFLGAQRVRNQLRACRRWPVAPVAPAFFAPVRSPVPVLILSGDMDATTPPDQARAVCAALGNCRLVSFPALAHGPFDLDRWQDGGCFDRIAISFFDAATPAALDTSCLARMKPPPFATVRPGPG